MRHFGQHLFPEPMAWQQRPLLVAGRTERSLTAGKRHEELFPAVLALDTGETFLDVAANLSIDERITDRQNP
jgi:hypothetical protein